MSKHLPIRAILPESVVKALEESGLTYEVISRRKHNQLILDGKLIGTFTRGRRANNGAGDKPSTHLIQRIRRVADQP